MHAEWFPSRKDEYGEDLQQTLSGPLPDAKGLADAYRASYDIKEGVRRTFEVVDLLVTPTTMRTASLIGEEEVEVDGFKMSTGGAFAQLTMPFNIAGVPAISVPCGFDGEGLPIGLQIAGGPFEEAKVLRAARAFEMG